MLHSLTRKPRFWSKIYPINYLQIICFLFIITTLESINQMNFKSCLKSLSSSNVLEAYLEPCQTPEMDRFVKTVNN